MPKVYRVLRDAHYQQLEPVSIAEYFKVSRDAWAFQGIAVQASWQNLELYVREPMLSKPDIWQIMRTFAFEDRACHELQMFLDQAGEQFSVPFENRKLTLLNVTYVIDALDTKQSETVPGLAHIINRYTFHVDRLDYSLFKIPETRMSEILTVEGLGSPDSEFKPLFEKHGLKGLQFQLLWDSNS